MTSIKKNYFYNTLLSASNILMPLITYPYVLRVLGPEGLGKANFAMSIAGYFLILAQFGISLFGIKEVAKVKDDKEKLNRVFSELFAINLIMSALSVIFYAALILTVGRFREEQALFFVTGATLAVNVFSIDWLYAGLEDYKYITIRSLAVRMLYIVLTFIVIKTGNDYVAYAALAVLLLLAGNAVNMIVLLKKVKPVFSGLNLKKYLAPLFMVFLGGAIASVYNKLDVVFLGLLSDEKAVGYYTANRRIITLVLAIVTSLTTVLIPRVAYYLENNMKKEYNRTAERSVNFLYFASMPVIAVCLVLPEEILRLLGGEKFLPGVFSLKLLSFQVLLTGMAVFLATQVALAHNDEKAITIANVAGALINVPVNLLLIKSLAHAAPSIAILCSEAAAIATLLFLTRKYLKFRIFKMQSLNYPAAALLMLGVAWLVKHFLVTNYIIVLTAALFASGAVYFIFLLAIRDENAVIITDSVTNRILLYAGKGGKKS